MNARDVSHHWHFPQKDQHYIHTFISRQGFSVKYQLNIRWDNCYPIKICRQHLVRNAFYLICSRLNANKPRDLSCNKSSAV